MSRPTGAGPCLNNVHSVGLGRSRSEAKPRGTPTRSPASGESKGEMRSPLTKPILGLLMLLAWPCLGWDGRAEAGFAPGVSTLSRKQSLDPLAEPDPFSNRE